MGAINGWSNGNLHDAPMQMDSGDSSGAESPPPAPTHPITSSFDIAAIQSELAEQRAMIAEIQSELAEQRAMRAEIQSELAEQCAMRAEILSMIKEQHAMAEKQYPMIKAMYNWYLQRYPGQFPPPQVETADMSGSKKVEDQ